MLTWIFFQYLLSQRENDVCCVMFIAGGLFGQAVQPQAQTVQLINTASALSAPTLLGDERDAILARWNQLQAFWGTGKGYFHNNLAPVEFTQENHFCRFKVNKFQPCVYRYVLVKLNCKFYEGGHLV